MIRPDLTPKDVEDITTLFDAAVRAAGLQAARLALPLMDKFTAAVRAAAAAEAKEPPSGE